MTDDEYDAPRYDDPRYDDRPPRRGVIEEAKERTYMPAIFLIITGAISLCGAVYGFVMLPSFDANMDAQIKIIEGNPNVPPAQKKAQVDMVRSIADTLRPLLLPAYLVVTAVALLTIFGGVQLMNLRGKAVVIAGSILSMIPVTSGCCCLGVPFGIWALVVLNNPVVRQGYLAAARSDDRSEFE